MRLLTRALLIAMLAQAAAFAAPAGAQSQDNTAVAVNKKDGKSVFKLAFSVKKASGDVDASNTAVAYASCTDCKTVAAAIQVVLVSGEPSSVSAENVAIAINYQCSECETLASAYQFVFGDGQEVQFTKEGKQRLHDLKKQFQELKQRDDLTLEELAAEIGAIAAEVAIVVDTEVELKKAYDAESTTTTVAGATTTTASSNPTADPSTTPVTSESTTSTSIDDTTTTSVTDTTVTDPPTSTTSSVP